MSNLISELLEFRKLEQNHKTLQISQQDITPFLKEIYFSFVDYAHLRNIHYDFQLSETPTLCWFDSQLLEKYSSIYYPMPLNIHPTMGILSYPAVQQIMK